MRRTGGSALARKSSKMTIGPWGHGPSQKYGDVDFGPEAAQSLFERELRWYDHYLKGVDNGIDSEPPVQIFYMGVNRWQQAQDWPLPATQVYAWYLAGTHRLTPDKPGASGIDSYLYDPNDPVPTVGGNNCCGTPTLAGPRDQRVVEARKDVLVYTSDELRSPLAIAGPVRISLFAETDGRDTDWAVKLVDVYPEGFAMNIAEGILRARFRKGVDKPELLNPIAYTSSRSIWPAQRTCFSRGTRSGSILRAATFRSSIAIPTRANLSVPQDVCGSQNSQSIMEQPRRRRLSCRLSPHHSNSIR